MEPLKLINHSSSDAFMLISGKYLFDSCLIEFFYSRNKMREITVL